MKFIFQRADLTVGAFTISYDRQAAISFTKPYKDIEMGGLLAIPKGNSYNPWSFLTPLSYRLWLTMIGSAFVVAALISLLDKLSPFGHHGERPYCPALYACSIMLLYHR